MGEFVRKQTCDVEYGGVRRKCAVDQEDVWPSREGQCLFFDGDCAVSQPVDLAESRFLEQRSRQFVQSGADECEFAGIG